MKPSPQDHPDLTAYALGELNSVEAARVRQMLAQSPEIRAEYERIAQTVAALREQTPPIIKRSLHPRQRETILAMGHPRVTVHPGRDQARRMAWSLTKLAAAAAVTAGAFALGMKYAERLEDAVRADAIASLMQNKKDAAPVAPAVQPLVVESPAVSVPAPEVKKEAPPLIVSMPPPPSPSMATVPITNVPNQVASANNGAVALSQPALIAQTPPPALKQSSPAPLNMAPPSLKAFVQTKAQPESIFLFQPKLVRPKVQSTEFAGIALAAPLPDHVKNAPKAAPHKPDAAPALVIHSWKAEIATCPWDNSRKLMRIVAQIPVDQAAVDFNEQDYHFLVKFDPAQVLGYRLITEKHMPPTGSSNLATRFAWYEIIPVRNYVATHDRPATLGALEVSQPHGVVAANNGPLKLLDRGSDWSETGEAFVFETAMVGFNLLLQGAQDVGSLNHRFVLDLAQQSMGDDPNGERAKFIKAVQQAQKAAGL